MKFQTTSYGFKAYVREFGCTVHAHRRAGEFVLYLGNAERAEGASVMVVSRAMRYAQGYSSIPACAKGIIKEQARSLRGRLFQAAVERA